MAKTATFDLTKENIFSTCNQLQAEGKKVTGDIVRERIGGGSPNVIMAALKEWKTSNTTTAKEIAVIEMPIEAIEAVKTAASIIWKAATEHQAQTIEAVRVECQKIEHEAQAEHDDAMIMAEKLGQENDQLKNEIYLLTEKIEQIIKEKNSQDLQIQKQQLIIDDCETRKKNLKQKLEASATAATAAQEEINRLKVENATIAAKADAATTTANEHKATATAAQEEINRLKVENATIAAKADAATTTAN